LRFSNAGHKRAPSRIRECSFHGGANCQGGVKTYGLYLRMGYTVRYSTSISTVHTTSAEIAKIAQDAQEANLNDLLQWVDKSLKDSTNYT